MSKGRTPLSPVEGAPGLFRTPEGLTVSIRDFEDFSTLYMLSEGKQTFSATQQEGERRIIYAIYVIVDPWPKRIPLDLTLRVSVCGEVSYTTPLVRVARPADRTLDLENRIERLETAFSIGARDLNPYSLRKKIPINEQDTFEFKITGENETVAKRFLQEHPCGVMLEGLRHRSRPV